MDRTTTTQQFSVHESSLMAAVLRRDSRITEIRSVVITAVPRPIDDPTNGGIFRFMEQREMFVEATNFHKAEILEIYFDAQPFFAQHRRKGRRSAIDDMGAIIIYLFWLSTGSKFSLLSKIFNFGEGAINSALSRVRQPLLEFLSSRWWNERRRPVPLPSRGFPFIALLCDSTSVEVHRPVGRFEEAKIYFDAKNRIYALKKQVAVMATSPHFALFSETAHIGSRHDYSIFKSSYSKLEHYLRKSDNERGIIASDNIDKWALLADSAYLGPDSDTPGLRKVAMKKPSQLSTEADVNEHSELASLRSPVERFFGRLKKLWSVTREIYRYFSSFDIVFLNIFQGGTTQRLMSTSIFVFS